MNVIELFKSARRAKTPLIAIASPDQRALASRVFDAVNGNGDVPPKILWDAIRGYVGANKEGAEWIAGMGTDVVEASANPVVAMELAPQLPMGGILVMFNAHRFIDDPIFATGIFNLRDAYCENGRTLLLLGPSFKLPSECNDVVLFDEEFPDDKEIGSILTRLYDGTYDGKKKPSKEALASSIDAARGLSAFSAEQAFAMSLEEKGINIDKAWDRKAGAVNQTQGVEFTRGGSPLTSLGGLAASKAFVERVFKGRVRYGVTVYMDEVEKQIAGATGPSGDSSGVAQDFMGTYLSWMERNKYDGLIAVGPPGSGKSAFAEAISATYNVPRITLDPGGLKGSLVGESEQALRQALKMIESVAGDSAFVVATCNKLESLPPEFRRRFRSGVWFFDLPTAEERKVIWGIHLKSYKMNNTKGNADYPIPDDEGWTGAEIRNCVDLAWRLRIDLVEASRYIIPIVKSNPASIEALRKAAEGRWLSASEEGVYTRTKKEESSTLGRKVEWKQ